jgi:thiamine transport system ATP-binding protein
MAGEGLRVEGVWFEAGGKPIVRGVSLTARAGETVAVLGPSGCGKTTLLRMIAGLARPSRGRVLFDGADITGVATHRRGFGMMFQDFALFPHLDVAGNVEFGLREHGVASKERPARVARLLERVGLAGYGKRTVETLSGGERQRVALARALAPEPRLLMLDEPLGALDRGLKERLTAELATTLHELDIPAVYVTHDQFEAFAIADRLAIMRDGEVVREGAPEEVYREPGTEFVARFLGFDNLVEGVFEGERLVTAVGEWAYSGAAPGAALVLLRNEGVALVEGPGPGVVRGTLAGRLFQGDGQRVTVKCGGQDLRFELAGSAPLPAEGSEVFVRVPSVQVVERDGDVGASPA